MSARILVVDDVLPNVKLLHAKLTREYFDVVTASNGFEALDAVKLHTPDIILLDVMMPGMDGFEVCRRLKADPETTHIPVVMVTALSDAADRVRGLEAGADDFLTKPVNDVALFARVRSLVRLKMMMDEWRLRQQTSDQLGMLKPNATMMSEPALNARVLVLDDSDIDLERISRTLAADQHITATAKTVDSAADLALSEDFELYVVSLTLLDEDGLRLVSRMRSKERSRQIPILLVADEGDLPRIVKGLELGANDYVMKPLDRNELLARVRTQVRRKRFQDQLRMAYERSVSMAMTDSLTGLYNRRYTLAHLDRLLSRIAETTKPVSVLMVDIDHFKQVNDTYGHGVGDEVLRDLTARLSANLRSFDLIGRLGGEEFLVILPDTTLENAMAVGERLRVRVAGRGFAVSASVGEISVTISLGAGISTEASEPLDQLLHRADMALYAAKKAGRNRVLAQDDAEPATPAA
jgi:two-component system, cell cycle response regulator